MRITPPPPMPMSAPSGRAYDANALRMASRQLLAYSEKDIARGIAQAMRDGRPVSILLAADIALSAPIVAPTELRGLQIDGGGLFRIVGPPEANHTQCVSLRCDRASFRGLTFRMHPDSTSGASTVSIVDVFNEYPGPEVFVAMEDILIEKNDNNGWFLSIFSESTSVGAVTCSLRNVVSNRDITYLQTVYLTSGTLGLLRSTIDTYGVELGALKTDTTAQSESCANWFGPGAPCVSVQTVDDGLVVYPCTPVVDIRIGATASGVFTIDTSFDSVYPDGTMLTLVCGAITAPGTCSLNDVAASKLAGAWTPNSVGDTLTLVRINNYWTEIARSNV